jgi:hypothetical protein
MYYIHDIFYVNEPTTNEMLRNQADGNMMEWKGGGGGGVGQHNLNALCVFSFNWCFVFHFVL